MAQGDMQVDKNIGGFNPISVLPPGIGAKNRTQSAAPLAVDAQVTELAKNTLQENASALNTDDKDLNGSTAELSSHHSITDENWVEQEITPLKQPKIERLKRETNDTSLEEEAGWVEQEITPLDQTVEQSEARPVVVRKKIDTAPKTETSAEVPQEAAISKQERFKAVRDGVSSFAKAYFKLYMSGLERIGTAGQDSLKAVKEGIGDLAKNISKLASTLAPQKAKVEPPAANHTYCSPTSNSNQANFKALNGHFKNNPEEAKSAVKDSNKNLAGLQESLKEHYSGSNITLFGRETLNRQLLTDQKFAPYMNDPKVLKGLVALSTLEDPSAKELNSLGGQMTMSGALQAAVSLHPNSLALIPPNGDKHTDTYISDDQSRRANVDNFAKAFSQAIPEGVEVSHSNAFESRWDTGYKAADWEGSIHIEFNIMCDQLESASEQDFKKYVDPSGTRPDLNGWATAPEGGVARGAQECKGGLELLVKGALGMPEGDKLSLANMTRDQLIDKLANSPIWLEPHVCHLALDRLHFGGVMHFGDQIQLSLAGSDSISGADLIKGVADRINEQGVNPSNQIAAEALFARMALITDFMKSTGL